MLRGSLLPLCLLSVSACMPPSRVPPVTTPRGNELFDKGVTLGVTMEMTGFGSTLEEDGEERQDVVYGPRRKIPILQLLSFGARSSLSTSCDAGFELSVSAVGGDLRCGVGDEHKTLAVSSGARIKWWHGIVGRTEVQAGAHKDGLLAFASTGVSYSYHRHAIALNEGTPLKNLFLGPRDPYLRVSQTELAWSNTLTLGFPLERRGPTLFISASLDAPFLTGAPGYDCVGCTEDRAFSDFDPGFRVGGMIGVAGTTD